MDVMPKKDRKGCAIVSGGKLDDTHNACSDSGKSNSPVWLYTRMSLSCRAFRHIILIQFTTSLAEI
jgi:hypothetical protein